MMLSFSNFRDIYPDIFEKIKSNFLFEKEFPCIFAMASFKKEVMKFLIFQSYEDILNNAPEALNLIKDKKFRDEIEKTYETLILVSDCFFGVRQRRGIHSSLAL